MKSKSQQEISLLKTVQDRIKQFGLEGKKKKKDLAEFLEINKSDVTRLYQEENLGVVKTIKILEKLGFKIIDTIDNPSPLKTSALDFLRKEIIKERKRADHFEALLKNKSSKKPS